MECYPQRIAVLTGDIARSTAMSKAALDTAMDAMTRCALENQRWLGEKFTRQSGDGWQLVVPNPEAALRSALALRATLRSLGPEFDTYISIAVGDLTEAPPSDLNQTNDPLFVNSGRELAILKERATKDGIMIAHWEMGCAASTAFLADYISQGWTPAQAEAMSIYLNPYSGEITYSEAARKLEKSRQALTKSLKAAGKEPILKALSYLEASLRADANGPLS